MYRDFFLFFYFLHAFLFALLLSFWQSLSVFFFSFIQVSAFPFSLDGIPASLPYFIPAFILSPFGTFGAAIILRGTLRNRRVLFDLGASGPLAGLE